jgi:deoxyribonuclease-4
MSIAGGVDLALQRGLAIGCRAVQIFTKNQLRWSAPPLGNPEIERFRLLRPAFAAVFAHTAYLINLASPREEVFRSSVAALAEELRRCRQLGIEALVLHPGFHQGLGEEAGARRVVEGAAAARQQAGVAGVRLLFETTSGAGSSLGGRFEQLRDLLAAAGAGGVLAGVCLDTCHVFAAGYDLRDPESCLRMWEQFDRIVGLQHLRALHLNDSKDGLGSRRDRHEHIGRGRLGLQAFACLLRDGRLKELPAVLETPKGHGLAEDARNLAVLRGLAQDAPGPGVSAESGW